MKRFPRYLFVILMVTFFFSLAGCHSGGERRQGPKTVGDWMDGEQPNYFTHKPEAQ